MITTSYRSTGRWIAAGIALVFGALTIISGGQALFGDAAAKAAAGDAVPFVLWFNFASGFAYVLAGVGIAMRKHWAGVLAAGLAFAILAVFMLFGLHILRGGAYEMRTVGAMVLRASVWVGIAAYLRQMAKAGAPNAQ